MYQIEIKNNLYYEESFIIDNNVYVFTLKWNNRSSIWTLDIKTNENEEIITGTSLVLNTNIFKYVQNPKKPNGFLLVLPLSENIKEINKDNILTDVGLFYLTEDDLLDPDWENFKIF